MINSAFKKSLIVFFTASIALSGFVAPKAKAITVSVISQSPDILGVLSDILAANNVTAAATTAETNQSIFEWSQQVILEVLKKRLLDEMVDDVIQWIQNGDDPRFVTDWEEFLKDAGNAAVGDFAQELGLGFLCQPFSTQLQAALFPVERFSNAISCTLDDIVANVENFYTDFEEGGWIGYHSAWEPQNNFFGAYSIAYREKFNRAVSAQAAASSEAQAGDGFLSTKSCDESPLRSTPDIDDDGTPGDYNCQITTPGSIVGDLVEDAVGVDFDYIVNARDLKAYVAAITNALINRLIREGIGGLSGLSTNSNPGDDFLPVSQDNPCATLTGDSYDICISYIGTLDQSLDFIKDARIEQIVRAITPRQELIELLSNKREILSQHLSLLAAAKDADSSCASLERMAKVQSDVATLDIRIDLFGSELRTLEALMAVIEESTDIAEISTAIASFEDVATSTATIQAELNDPDSSVSALEESLEDEAEELNQCINANS